VFTGKHVVDGTEEMPHAKPSFWFTDNYVLTKARSEQMITDANGQGGGLQTVSIRPHTIYGPADKYLFPTIAEKGGVRI